MSRRPTRPKRREIGPWPGRLGAAALGAMLVAVLLAPSLRSALRGEGETPGQHPSVGYNRIIDEIFAQRRWLIGHRDGDDGRPVVTVSRRVYGGVYSFYRHSFLRTDIQANDASLWRFSGSRVVGIDPTAHSVSGPFAQTRGWTGDILFRNPGPQELVLTHGEDRLTLLAPPPRWSPGTARPLAGQATPFDSTPDVASAVSFAILDASGAELASVVRIGDAAVVRVEYGAPGRVSVGPSEIRPDPDYSSYRQLRQGERLRVRNGDGMIAEYRLEIRRTGLSTYVQGGERQRDADTISLADGVEAAMTRLAATGETPTDWATRSVVTTLDQPLQTEGQAKLRDASLAVRRWLPDQATFRSAALVMDGQTGEILAAATFPAQLTDLNPAERSSRTAREMLEHNQNFTRLPIGSVAKIPFSTAILTRFPDLRTLRVTGAGRSEDPTKDGLWFAELLGQRLEAELPEESPLGNIGFADFIRTSSNKYASTLMLLASAPNPFVPGPTPAGEGYELNGARQGFLPLGAYTTRPIGRSAVLRRPAGAPNAQLAWLKDMDRLFDMPRLGGVGDRSEPDAPTDAYDLGIWRALIGRRQDPDVRGFMDVSPERESFAMGTIRNLRNDYLQLILGGGRSRWTTIKVGEVFSRLVTAKQIKATMVSPQSQAGDFKELTFVPAARDTMLSAMEEVAAAPGGTATGFLAGPVARLRARLPAGETLKVYAKTGTPTLERRPASPVNAAVDELMGLGIVKVDPDIRRLRVNGASTVAAIRHRLAADADARDVLAQHRVSAAAAARYIVTVNSRTPQLITGDDVDDEGWSLAPDGLERGDGGVIAISLARYRAGQAAPIRVITVVINIQGKIPKEAGVARYNAATRMAGDWLSSERLAALILAPVKPPPTGAAPSPAPGPKAPSDEAPAATPATRSPRKPTE